jgi:hsp70-interacting protein
MSEPESNDIWLGLLKWSLNHVDGTVPSSESPGFKEMSAEDKAFLEEVMKNGIIDEGKRMKTILSSLVGYLENILQQQQKVSESDTTEEPISEDEASTLLIELRDIVEQIDYAKSFAAMGGIKFLIGCSAEKERIPKAIRSGCLKVLSTLCQNNPPVQYMMLEQGTIVKLLEMYFAEFPSQQQGEGNAQLLADTSLRANIVQAMSSSIRNHETAEKIFRMNEESVKMIESGLGLHHENETLPCPDLTLRRKTLFFLQALVTSDSADVDCVNLFTRAIQYTACNFLDPKMEPNQEMREMTLSMLVRILDRNQGVNSVLNMKSTLIGLGVTRVSTLRAMEGDEAQYTEEELKLWESLIVGIARTS